MKLEPEMPCSRTSRELAAYLYDELDARTRERLEAHLLVCAPCRDELERARATTGTLDEWPLVADRADPRRLAAIARDAARAAPARSSGRLVRLTATLVAAAAALLVGLSLLGADVTVRDDGLHLRLAMPWADPGAWDAGSRESIEDAAARAAQPLPISVEPLEPELRRIAAEELTTRAVDWQRSLVTAVDRSQAEDRRAIQALTALINELSRRQVLQDRRTKDALVELTEAVFDLDQ